MTYVILSVGFLPGLIVVETPTSQRIWGSMETTKKILQFNVAVNGLSLL
jgi:hypothetical protein